MYFPSGGGTLKGISKPGEIVWSRIYVEDGRLKADIGRGKVSSNSRGGNRTPLAASPRRNGRSCTPSLYGVTRDQMMGPHKANHIQVAYAPDAAGANLALAAKAAMFAELGLDVRVCGTNHGLA